MKAPDLDKEYSEQERSLADFLRLYNKNLPRTFPQASIPLLEEFRATHLGFFKLNNTWSLDVHRKKFMDWLCTRTLLHSKH